MKEISHLINISHTYAQFLRRCFLPPFNNSRIYQRVNDFRYYQLTRIDKFHYAICENWILRYWAPNLLRPLAVNQTRGSLSANNRRCRSLAIMNPFCPKPWCHHLLNWQKAGLARMFCHIAILTNDSKLFKVLRRIKVLVLFEKIPKFGVAFVGTPKIIA